MIKLSIIIPTRSRYQNLQRVVSALAQQTLPQEQFEVIISDDNSSDETQSIINSYRNELALKYLFNCVPKPHSWNASVPRNFGALLADRNSNAYLFVDSDVVLPSSALEHYLEDYQANPHRVVIGAYDFLTQNGDKVTYFDGVQGDVRSNKFNEVDVNEVFNTLHDGLACFGGNLLIPKDIFWSVGGFDEDVHIGLEDGSMGLKLWKKQVGFSYDKRTWGTHLWHESPVDRFPHDMATHINALNQKHFHMDTSEVDKSIDIITASRETYASWGLPNWQPPESWLKNE